MDSFSFLDMPFLHKLLIASGISASLLGGTALIDMKTSPKTTPITLKCFVADLEAVYDTPSGKIEPGYYAEGTKPVATTTLVAHQIGEKAWKECFYPDGTKVNIDIPATEYHQFTPSVPIPDQIINVDTQGAVLDSVEQPKALNI